MHKLLIFILVVGFFSSCEVNTQDWRARSTKSGNITILNDLERGFKAGDTIAGNGTRFVLLELVNK